MPHEKIEDVGLWHIEMEGFFMKLIDEAVDAFRRLSGKTYLLWFMLFFQLMEELIMYTEGHKVIAFSIGLLCLIVIVVIWVWTQDVTMIWDTLSSACFLIAGGLGDYLSSQGYSTTIVTCVGAGFGAVGLFFMMAAMIARNPTLKE
jgi:hypothetical protein